MTRILSVSYDLPLLSSRRLLLESLGCEVVSASDFGQALKQCSNGTRFDLFVLGHSIPNADKNALITTFRSYRSAPIVALSKMGEEPAMGADFQIEPEPGPLLEVISRIIEGEAASA
jgi:CheY-like chemotaxis protein